MEKKPKDETGAEREINEFIERHFQELGKEEKAAEELKTEVFNTLDLLNLVGELTDLFTVKFALSEATLLDALSQSPPPEDSLKEPEDSDSVDE